MRYVAHRSPRSWSSRSASPGWCPWRAVEVMPDRRATPFAQVAFLTLFVTACLLAYFDLRARALSPADRGGAHPGAAGAHPPAFPLQQHQRRAFAHPLGAAAGRARPRGPGGPLPRAHGRQPHAHPDRQRDRARAPVPRASRSCAWAIACGSPGARTTMPADALVPPLRAAAAGGERGLPRHRASPRRAARSPSTSAWPEGQLGDDAHQPLSRRNGAPSSGNKMAHRPTSASACSCTSTPRRA